jgi:hypothetical protein
MAIFNSYVKLPEGIYIHIVYIHQSLPLFILDTRPKKAMVSLGMYTYINGTIEI